MSRAGSTQALWSLGHLQGLTSPEEVTSVRHLLPPGSARASRGGPRLDWGCPQAPWLMRVEEPCPRLWEGGGEGGRGAGE